MWISKHLFKLIKQNCMWANAFKNYKILRKIQDCLFPFYYSCPENKTKQKLARDSNNINIKETLINEKTFYVQGTVLTNFISFNLNNTPVLDTVISPVYKRINKLTWSTIATVQQSKDLRAMLLAYFHVDTNCLMCFPWINSTLKPHNFCTVWQTSFYVTIMKGIQRVIKTNYSILKFILTWKKKQSLYIKMILWPSSICSSFMIKSIIKCSTALKVCSSYIPIKYMPSTALSFYENYVCRVSKARIYSCSICVEDKYHHHIPLWSAITWEEKNVLDLESC